MNPSLQALVDRVRSIDLTPRQKQLLAWVGYPAFAFVVALSMFVTSVPRERVKDRLEAALSADVSSGQPMAIGMDVTIGDLDLTMLTGVGFKASDIVLRTRPINLNDKPTRYLIEDLRVRLGVLSTLFGRASYSFKAHALSGTASGQVSGNNDGTKLKIELDKLVLTGVPSIQQAVGLPIDGSISGGLDVEVVKNLVANTSGTVDLDVEDAVIGDGKAKLTVPTDPFLAAGVTIPRIVIGKLAGQIVIDKGRARFEGVRVHSADVDATIDGYLELRDPIGLSQMHAYLKFRPSEALIKREPTIELLNNALGSTGKRSDGFIGVQLTGSLMGILFVPSKDPPFGVTSVNGGPASAPTPTPMAPPLSRPLPSVAQPPLVAQPPVALPPPPPIPPANNEPPPSPAVGAGVPPPSGANAPSGVYPPSGANAPAPSGANAPPPGAGGASSPPGMPPPGEGREGVPPAPPGSRMMRPAFRGGTAAGSGAGGGSTAAVGGAGGGSTEENPPPPPAPAPATE